MYVGRSADGLATEIATAAWAVLNELPPRGPLELVTHALAERLGPIEALPPENPKPEHSNVQELAYKDANDL